METIVKDFVDYMNANHSVYHATAALKEQLINAGYTQLSDYEEWNLVPGGKYCVTKSDSSLMAFRFRSSRLPGL